jgi:hypothetical protein
MRWSSQIDFQYFVTVVVDDLDGDFSRAGAPVFSAGDLP